MSREHLATEIKVRVTQEAKRRLNEIAAARPPGESDSESAVVREAIREYLDRHAALEASLASKKKEALMDELRHHQTLHKQAPNAPAH